MYSNKQQYVGYYHTIKGNYYTGKRYINGISSQIYQIQKTQQDEPQFYQHALPFKEFINSQKINYKQFQFVTYPKKELQQIYTVYILYNINDCNIYDVKQLTYNKYKDHICFKAFKIKLKKEVTIQNYSYNNINILEIENKKVRQYLNTIR